MGMNIKYCLVHGIFWLSLAALQLVDQWGCEEPCLQLCRAESSSKEFCPVFIHPFFFPFQFMQLLCRRYCSLGELWSHSQSMRGLEKKQSLWKSLCKNLPIVRGLWTPAVLGWYNELINAQLFSYSGNNRNFVAFQHKRLLLSHYTSIFFGMCLKLHLNIHSVYISVSAFIQFWVS